ncbi:MAG: MoxR family ATPase [Bacteroidetes bacterium]|nr:MoxR family ATPase [Bacteroidota bacterium]
MENQSEETQGQMPAQQPSSELFEFSSAVYRLKQEIQKVIVGQDQTIDLMLAGLMSGGHVLIEGVPGIAKTMIAKLLARALSVHFSRIQFTPDMMPTDVTGTTVYNLQKSEFTFNKGPIFSNFVLIDEINRAPAKTQAALFEVMEERQISVDGTTHKLEFPFFVIATQNPIEQEGTYKLPEAQLDRFVFRILMDYPSLDQEVTILKRFSEDFTTKSIDTVKPVISIAELSRFRGLIEKVFIKDELIHYISKITYATRNHGSIFLGASPRASLAILRTAKATAAMQGRDFVTPDDIRKVALPVLNHRIIVSPEKEMEGITPESIIQEITQSIEVPR